MARANRTVMGRAVTVPSLYKLAGTQGEAIAAVGAANFQDLACDTEAFRNQKREAKLRMLNDGQQRDWTVLDRHLNREPSARFSMVNIQRPDADAILRNAGMSRTIMPHQDKILREVNGIVLSK